MMRIAAACLGLSVILAGCDTRSQSATQIAEVLPPALPSAAARPVKAAQSDIEQVCQLTLDLPALQQYYHVEDAPNRKPLVVASNEHLSADVQLTKFGEPVKLMQRAEAVAAKKPYFEFTAMKIEGDTARVSFRYPVEGISGDLALRREGGAWQVESHKIVER